MANETKEVGRFPTKWNYRFVRAIPMVYDESLSLEELVNKLFYKVRKLGTLFNDLADNVEDFISYIDGRQAEFEQNIQNQINNLELNFEEFKKEVQDQFDQLVLDLNEQLNNWKSELETDLYNQINNDIDSFKNEFNELLRQYQINTDQKIEDLQTNVSTQYNELRTYIDQQIASLDIQQTVTDILDQWKADGTLADIIAGYVTPTTIFTYDSVEQMVADEARKEDDYMITYGYFNIGDGGSAYYKVVERDTNPNSKEYIPLRNNLYAQYIPQNNVYVDQFGIGVNTASNYEAIQFAIDYAYNHDLPCHFTNKQYIISSSLTLKGSIIGNECYINDQSTSQNTFVNNTYIENVNFISQNGCANVIDNNNVIFNNCTFTTETSNAIAINRGTTIQIRNCNTNNNIIIYSSSNCTFKDNNFNLDLFQIGNCNFLNIKNNTFTRKTETSLTALLQIILSKDINLSLNNFINMANCIVMSNADGINQRISISQNNFIIDTKPTGQPFLLIGVHCTFDQNKIVTNVILPSTCINFGGQNYLVSTLSNNSFISNASQPYSPYNKENLPHNSGSKNIGNSFVNWRFREDSLLSTAKYIGSDNGMEFWEYSFEVDYTFNSEGYATILTLSNDVLGVNNFTFKKFSSLILIETNNTQWNGNPNVSLLLTNNQIRLVGSTTAFYRAKVSFVVGVS